MGMFASQETGITCDPPGYMKPKSYYRLTSEHTVQKILYSPQVSLFNGIIFLAISSLVSGFLSGRS